MNATIRATWVVLIMLLLGVCCSRAEARNAPLALFVHVHGDSVSQANAYTAYISDVFGKAVDADFNLKRSLIISDSLWRRLSRGNIAPLADMLPVEERHVVKYYVVADVTLDCTFGTKDARIPLFVVPPAGSGPGGILRIDDSITIHDTDPEYHYTVMARWRVFDARSGSTIHSWETDGEEESNVFGDNARFEEAIQSASDNLYKNLKGAFRGSVDLSGSAVYNLQMMYGTQDLNAPGTGTGGGMALRFIPLSGFGAAIEYRGVQSSRFLGRNGGLLGPTDVTYRAHSLSAVLMPGPVLRIMRPLDFFYPHGEFAVGYQSVGVDLLKEEKEYHLWINNWTFGIGGGALFALRHVPLGVEPFMRLSIGVKRLSEEAAHDLMEYLDLNTGSGYDAFGDFSFLFGIRAALVLNTSPIK